MGYLNSRKIFRELPVCRTSSTLHPSCAKAYNILAKSDLPIPVKPEVSCLQGGQVKSGFNLSRD